MDKSVDKWTFEKVANQQTVSNAGGSAGPRTPDYLIKIPLPPINLSDLPQKTVQTFADKRVFSDKLKGENEVFYL